MLLPHDQLFKSIFGQREEATAVLRSVLPPGISSAIAWETLTRKDAHYVDEDLAFRQSDLVFTAKLDNDKEALIYLLFEHQSSNDELMAFRLLTYAVRALEAWRKDHPKAKRLPALVPVVLAQTPDGWQSPRSMLELYQLDESKRRSFAEHVPNLHYVLEDISQAPDAAIQARFSTALTRFALLLLRHGRDTALTDRMTRWAADLAMIANGPEGNLIALMRYVILVNKGQDLEDLARRLKPILGKERSQVVVTLGEQLIEQGRVETRLKEREQFIFQVLEARGWPVTDDVRARILACTDADQLARWIERAFKATGLDDVFAADD